jgi:hypothetical protein
VTGAAYLAAALFGAAAIIASRRFGDAAPIRAKADMVRARSAEEYTGHVIDMESGAFDDDFDPFDFGGGDDGEGDDLPPPGATLH